MNMADWARATSAGPRPRNTSKTVRSRLPKQQSWSRPNAANSNARAPRSVAGAVETLTSRDGNIRSSPEKTGDCWVHKLRGAGSGAQLANPVNQCFYCSRMMRPENSLALKRFSSPLRGFKSPNAGGSGAQGAMRGERESVCKLGNGMRVVNGRKLNSV